MIRIANVKFNGNTFYVPSDKMVVCIKDDCEVHYDSSLTSEATSSVTKGQVFSVLAQRNKMYKIKLGWINEEAAEILLEPINEITDLAEPFVVKVIVNTPVFTEPSTKSHITTLLRIGDLQQIVGESEDFFKLEHGGFIEKRGCRRY